MERNNAFSACHPAVCALYFGLVLLCSMCLMHPVCLAISLVSAILCRRSLCEGKTAHLTMRLLLPLLLLAALINPAFNHRGVTILGYLPSGNPLTLESALYGLAAAGMLLSVLLWCACLSEVMTSDKLLCLLGRTVPALSLLLSMTLRFVPRFGAQLKQARAAQKGLGLDVSEGSPLQRLRRGGAILSILLTWSLENAVETADSMKGRGYGLPGRTAYHPFSLSGQDRGLLLWLSLCGLYLLCGWRAGCFYWRYFPMLLWGTVSPLTVTFYLCYLALCLTPVFLNRREERLWKR